MDRKSLGVGHCIMVPKQHAVKVYDLDESEYQCLFSMARRLAPELEQAPGTMALGYVGFGSGLPHAHLHLVPHNTPEVLAHPQPRLLSGAQLRDQADQLRPFLASLGVKDA